MPCSGGGSRRRVAGAGARPHRSGRADHGRARSDRGASPCRRAGRAERSETDRAAGRAYEQAIRQAADSGAAPPRVPHPRTRTRSWWPGPAGPGPGQPRPASRPVSTGSALSRPGRAEDGNRCRSRTTCWCAAPAPPTRPPSPKPRPRLMPTATAMTAMTDPVAARAAMRPAPRAGPAPATPAREPACGRTLTDPQSRLLKTRNGWIPGLQLPDRGQRRRVHHLRPRDPRPHRHGPVRTDRARHHRHRGPADRTHRPRRPHHRCDARRRRLRLRRQPHRHRPRPAHRRRQGPHHRPARHRQPRHRRSRRRRQRPRTDEPPAPHSRRATPSTAGVPRSSNHPTAGSKTAADSAASPAADSPPSKPNYPWPARSPTSSNSTPTTSPPTDSRPDNPRPRGGPATPGIPNLQQPQTTPPPTPTNPKSNRLPRSRHLGAVGWCCEVVRAPQALPGGPPAAQ